MFCIGQEQASRIIQHVSFYLSKASVDEMPRENVGERYAAELQHRRFAMEPQDKRFRVRFLYWT